MSEKFKYTGGLRSTGPYQSSGQPYITGSLGITLNEEDHVTFPTVTKEVTISIPSVPNTAYNFVEDDGFFFACNNGGTGPFNLGGEDGGTTRPFTVSVWIKPTAGNQGDAILSFFQAGSKKSELQIRNSGVRFRDRHSSATMTNLDTGGSSIVGGGWKNYIITQSGSTSTHIYENGVHKAKVNNILAKSFDDIFIPGNSLAVMHGGYDHLTVWDSLLDHRQVEELYNGGNYFDPRVHSLVDNLQAWYTFGDDPGDSIGASAVIQDLSPNDSDTSMNGFGGSDALTLIAGPFTSTTGQLRIHMLSTGSAAGSTRVFGNKHFIELSNYEDSVTLPMKTKDIFLSSNDAVMQYDLYASLTNIPTASMYALTGSGIDE